MSSKKKEKNEWLACHTCNKFYAKPSLQYHQQSCENKERELESEEKSVEFSYILEDVFTGKLKVADSSQNALPHFILDTVLMHPNTLKCANFPISSRVELTYQDQRVICSVWPCSLTNLETAVISSSKFKTLKYKPNFFVKIRKCNYPPVVVSKVQLKPIEESSSKIFEDLKDQLLDSLDDSVVTVGETVITCYYGNDYGYTISELVHDDCCLADQLNNLCLNEATGCSSRVNYISCISFDETKVELESVNNKNLQQESTSSTHYTGGLFSQKKEINDTIILPLRNCTLFHQYSIEMPHGVIFHGQTGTGKTTMARYLQWNLPNVHFKMTDASDLISQYVGEAEEKLKAIFVEVMNNSPSVLVIDDFNILCPNNSSNPPNESEKRMISTVAQLMDSIPPNLLFIAVGITGDIASVNPQLRRSGRFDKDIEFTVPNAQERFDILRHIIKEKKHRLSEHDINDVVELTHGFVPADLQTLSKEASIIALQDFVGNDETKEIPTIDKKVYRSALLKVRPSAMKAVTIDIPKVYWSDVGGQSIVKQKLKECIEWPLKYPDTFKRMGISSPKGLLMYGPPGCSKTLMAKALATESGLNFISIKGPELFNKYLGESERAVREVFKKARAAAPSIVFFDEIDALGIKRTGGSTNNSVADRVLAQLLTELDGVEGLEGVIIVAATNRPDVIDSALLRPGRIDRLIYVPLPDAETRKEIFAIQFRTIPIDDDVSMNSLVEISTGYSGAEICALCREAAITALRENFDCTVVKHQDFVYVFDQRKPAVPLDLVKFYEDFAAGTTLSGQ